MKYGGDNRYVSIESNFSKVRNSWSDGLTPKCFCINRFPSCGKSFPILDFRVMTLFRYFRIIFG